MDTLVLTHKDTVVRLSLQDETRRPLALQQLTANQKEGSPLLAVAAGDFSAHSQFSLTWTALESLTEQSGKVELEVDGSRFDCEHVLVKETAGSFYRVTGSCDYADAKGVLRFKLGLPTTTELLSDELSPAPVVFELALISTLSTEEFAEPSPAPTSDLAVSSPEQNDVTLCDDQPETTQEVKAPLVVKLKIPAPSPSPKRSKAAARASNGPKPLDILSPLKEVTEPPTSPFVRSSSLGVEPSPEPVVISPPASFVSVELPREEFAPLPQPKAAEKGSSKPKRVRANSLASVPVRQQTDTQGPEKKAKPQSSGKERAPKQPRQPVGFVQRTGVDEYPQQSELRQVLGSIQEKKRHLQQTEMLSSHYCNTATILLNRLRVCDLCQHLDEQLANRVLTAEERINIALAKQRAVLGKRDAAVTAVSAEMRGLLSSFNFS